MIFMAVFIVFAGPYINSKSIPSYWLWMPWVSVFSYAFRGLMYTVLYGREVTCDSQ